MLEHKTSGTTRQRSRFVRPLELRQYRYFVVLAEELHFARAAERLSIGQSNLSREIRSLEHQTGVRLFFRTSRHTELSAAGRRLLDHARRVLAAEELARLEIGSLRRSPRERLRIGICERIACLRIASALSAWRSAQQGVNLQIFSRSGRQLLCEIEAGLIDAGITAISVTEPGMVAETLWRDDWVAALPKGHALGSARAIEFVDLAREPLALLAPNFHSALERELVEQVGAANPSLFIADHPSTVLALMTWVEAGCGVGLLTHSQGECAVHPSVILRPLRRGPPPVDVRLLRADAPPSPALSTLLECLRASPR